jgi:hypothetical protein
MDYASYDTLEELLRDGGATEFWAIVPEIPVTLSRQELLDWSGPGWIGEYQAALTAFKRLVGAADNYDDVMAQVAEIQKAMNPPEQSQEPDDQEPDDQEPDEEPAPGPGEAAAAMAQAITVPAIEALREQYPQVAARFTAEQIRAAAMTATTAAVSGTGQ